MVTNSLVFNKRNMTYPGKTSALVIVLGKSYLVIMSSRFDAAALATRRATAGLSQAELGARVNATQQIVSYWERGVYTPSADYLPALADALGCPMEDLFTPLVTECDRHR
jgi:DNA-binding XRE family transcriptional regulator